MFKRFQKSIRDFAATPKIKDFKLGFKEDSTWSNFPTVRTSIFQNEESKHREDMRAIAIAEFNLQKDSIQKNLKVQHHIMIVTLVAAMAAILSSIIAIIIALNSDPPKITVEVNNQKTSQKAN
jgi:hypothetical protein